MSCENYCYEIISQKRSANRIDRFKVVAFASHFSFSKVSKHIMPPGGNSSHAIINNSGQTFATLITVPAYKFHSPESTISRYIRAASQRKVEALTESWISLFPYIFPPYSLTLTCRIVAFYLDPSFLYPARFNWQARRCPWLFPYASTQAKCTPCRPAPCCMCGLLRLHRDRKRQPHTPSLLHDLGGNGCWCFCLFGLCSALQWHPCEDLYIAANELYPGSLVDVNYGATYRSGPTRVLCWALVFLCTKSVNPTPPRSKK